MGNYFSCEEKLILRRMIDKLFFMSMQSNKGDFFLGEANISHDSSKGVPNCTKIEGA